jgi:hypothetical protein
MQQLTQAGEQAIADMARRYGLSIDAVRTMLFAVSAGGGSMAQFYCPELGGSGQWMRGGMTMVGDMFNYGLQATVSNLCGELSNLLANTRVFEAPAASQNDWGGMAQGTNWWPAELGMPSSSGGQNDSRYAYFPGSRRLAIQQNGQVTLYDTLDHQIGGVQQQQGGNYGSLSFSSQFGTFTVESLPQVSPASNVQAQAPAPQPMQQPAIQQTFQAGGSLAPAPMATHSDLLNAIEKLGSLHQMGVLSDDEFRTKKAELLARL